MDFNSISSDFTWKLIRCQVILNGNIIRFQMIQNEFNSISVDFKCNLIRFQLISNGIQNDFK